MAATSSKQRKIRKVLIANRGEIAVRVIRALRELEIEAAVVYSEVDREGLPVLLADEAYCIGPAPSRDSYLQASRIVQLARHIGADAIHPGYGFLSENAEFARLCGEAGITFLGPSPDAIAAMGSKIESRRLMMKAGVAIVPGQNEELADVTAAAAAAQEVGYPVMLKAAAGGGGKGMRLVPSPEELPAAYRAACSEAMASFGSDAVYVERYIEEPRHVEIQVLGDLHGRVVAVGERECSLQRRHQKVVEECPSPVVDPELRHRMSAAAVAAAEAVGYTSAGTVEFLLDRSGKFYFLEMNTRLQVEHPVTEMVMGVDLVIAQIQVAEGEPLGADFDSLLPRGHAIEVRLYAEDPFRRFVPSPGRIDLLRLPEGPGIRNDCGVYEGSQITVHYDPMLGKLIAWGGDRRQAIARLGRALAELRIEGIHTTAPLYRQLLADADFCAGNLDIGMLDRKLQEGAFGPSEADGTSDIPFITAALAHFERQSRLAGSPSHDSSPTHGIGRRSEWRRIARREALRRGAWS